MLDWVVAVASGFTIGLSLGLMGSGGSLLSIPVLLYVFGFSLRTTIGSSLCLAATGALPSIVAYVQKGQVHFRAALVLGISGALGAAGGSVLSGQVPQHVLLGLLIAAMGASAVYMLKPRRAVESENCPAQFTGLVSYAKLASAGFGVGILTGLVGVGGGFLLVPVLMIIARLEPRQAIATSLAIIFTNAVTGLLGYLPLLPLKDTRFLTMLASVLVGSLAGFWLSFRLQQHHLRQGIGVLLILLALLLIWRPPA